MHEMTEFDHCSTWNVVVAWKQLAATDLWNHLQVLVNLRIFLSFRHWTLQKKKNYVGTIKMCRNYKMHVIFIDNRNSVFIYITVVGIAVLSINITHHLSLGSRPHFLSNMMSYVTAFA